VTGARADMRSTREWLAYLAGATESIGSSLDLERIAVGLAAAVVPGLADHAVVYLSDYLLRETDPSRREAASQAACGWPPRRGTPAALA
jgi:hypothetical protein